ncbi:uncharacterized protein LOC128679754 isoform X2 [Plodia interpunctella]|uniref:uncharacterized protein LOC128679754 isoform X2 n=1 Tax=Plodia interpunctella TaxID=58824 RepID=UPI00236779AE|nr:uncharacterized protein LOC128679754 isoform X2 [Plodia interpunctella]
MKLLLLFHGILISYFCCHAAGENVVPLLIVNQTFVNGTDKFLKTVKRESDDVSPSSNLTYFPFIMLIDQKHDTSEYWRETEILTLVRNDENEIDYDKCEQSVSSGSVLQLPSRRTVRPICRTNIDYQICPQCPHFSNFTECELFRDSCKERRVLPSEFRTYCDRKYGKWRTMFLPADYNQCRCCDECIFYRELDQSCVQDEYNFDFEEFLPVTSIDFRAGCNPYWGHPEQEYRALRCDKTLRRCVPVASPTMPKDTLVNVRRSFRYSPLMNGKECPVSCRGYACKHQFVHEWDCAPGAFIPDREQCNCCGQCTMFYQLDQKCAEFKKTFHNVNGSKEIEVEEEFLEPGCDDGLVCRQGRCQDIHIVSSATVTGERRKRDDEEGQANEPCKTELKFFKKKYGSNGHLHYDAPQCSPLWLYSPVQCRQFICYCALEDGTFIEGIKVPRVEVSNMNCDCARDKCRTGSDVECDGYGNYKEAIFSSYQELDVGRFRWSEWHPCSHTLVKTDDCEFSSTSYIEFTELHSSNRKI